MQAFLQKIFMQVQVYRFKIDGWYLYCQQDNPVSWLDGAILQKLGTPTWVLNVDLAQKNLAQVDNHKVADAIASVGYFLQAPPPTLLTKQIELADLAQKDSHL